MSYMLGFHCGGEGRPGSDLFAGFVWPWLDIALGLGLGSINIFATHNIFYRALGVGGWAVFGIGVRAFYIYKECEAIAGRFRGLWEGLGLGVRM